MIEGPRADLAERANVSQGLRRTNVSHGPIRWLTKTDWSTRCARAGSNRVRRSVRAYRMGSEVSKRDRGTSGADLAELTNVSQRLEHTNVS